MGMHRYKFQATFSDVREILEFQVIASSDASAWAKATKDAHDYKARELGGIGCHLEQIERVD